MIYFNKKSMKVQIVFLLITTLFIIVICFLTACQPMPDQEVIIQKRDDTLEAGIKTTATTNQTEQMSDQEKWEYQKEYESGHQLMINAIIMNKNKTGVPVISVNENPFEDGENTKKIVEVFCPDTKVYDLGMSLTKSQIEEAIIYHQEMLYKLQNGLIDEEQAIFEIADVHKSISMEELESMSKAELLKAKIEELKEEYRIAPDDSDLEETAYQFEKKGEALQLNLKATKNGHVVYFDFVNWNTGNNIYSGSTFLMRDSEYIYPTKILDIFVAPSSFSQDVVFTKEKEMIDQYIVDMGIDYMTLQSVCRNDMGYDFYYTRTVNGFPETYVNTYLGTQTINSDGMIVMDLWRSEYLHIEIQNGKIVNVKWSNPSEMINFENENVQILPWERIQEIFIKQMDYLLLPKPTSNSNGKDTTVFSKETKIFINKIELGLTKVLMKNSKNDYKLIPTWSFMGYDSNYVQEGVNTGAEVCFVTISAIDGTIIDRGLMY